MKRHHKYLSLVAGLLAIATLPLASAPLNAQTTQLTPQQKAALEAKKKAQLKAQQQQKAAPKVVQPKAAPKTAPKVVQPKSPPKVVPKVVQPKVTAKPPVVQKVVPKTIAKPVTKTPPPPVVKKVTPPPTTKQVVTPPVVNRPTVKNNTVKRPFVRKPPPGQTVTSPGAKPTTPVVTRPGQKPVPALVKGRPAKVPPNLEALKAQRKQIVAKRGNAVVIKEPGQRTIVKKGNRSAIVHNESNRLKRVAPNSKTLKQGKNNVTVIQRANNVQIYNITDSSGQLVKRYRRDGDGRETVLIDNESRRKKTRWGRNLAIGLGVGAGIIAGAAILNAVADVPPPRVDVPRRKYVVDYEDADDEEVYEAFSAPPVDRIERRYTLDEVRATPHLRDRMRRVDLNDITFDSGSWEVSESQYNKLERVARALKRVIDKDPNEVFMVEGYTDAVGAEDDNLSLSDRRAESVAVILSQQFDVPAENLTTQGYGEQYLKVPTDGPERANRRVAVRRITPLLSQGERRPEPREEPMVEQQDDQTGQDEEQYDDRQGQYDDQQDQADQPR